MERRLSLDCPDLAA